MTETQNPPHTPDVSVVVPTYRGAPGLPELTSSLADVFAQRGESFEIVLVNDSSPDDTWDVIEKLSDDDERVRGVDLLHNHGQPMATMCGLAQARGRVVATMDDDLEHRPDQLGVLLDALDAHPEWDAVVATWPLQRGGMRDLGSRIHAIADRVAWGTPAGFRHTAFRAMRRPVCDALVAHHTRSPVVGPMLHRVSSQVHNVEVEAGRRRHGVSGFTIREGAQRVVQNFTSGSTAPLKLISVLGLLLALAAFIAGGALLARWALGAQSPAGWLSVMLVVVFVGGMNMLAFGVMGGYVDIIVREVRQPPRWSIRRTSGRGTTREEGDS